VDGGRTLWAARGTSWNVEKKIVDTEFAGRPHLISLAQDAAAQLDLDPGLRRGLLGPAVHMLSEVGGALDTDVPLGLRRRGRERRRRQCQ